MYRPLEHKATRVADPGYMPEPRPARFAIASAGNDFLTCVTVEIRDWASNGEALMSSMKRRNVIRSVRANSVGVLLLTAAGGCQMGLPLDRDVQITQHLGGNAATDQPPPTRLASSNSPSTAAAGQNTPAYHRISDTELSEPASQNSPSETTFTFTDQLPADDPSPEPASEAALKPINPAEEQDNLAELLAAFRNSPPEVQQQAIAQLIAAVGPRASRTAQPSDISEQLKQSLSSLPALPEDVFDSPVMPVRLGSGAGIAAVLAATSDDNSVSQAIAASTDVPGAIAPASSTGPGPAEAMLMLPIAEPPAAALLMPPAANALESASDAELFNALLTRLQSPQPGESEGERLRREIIKRQLQVLSGDLEAAAEPLAGLSDSEQEFLNDQLAALGTITQAGGHPAASRRFSAALPQFRSAVQHLSQAAEQLELRSLAFCTEILSYGQVTRFPSNRFEAGQRVILYCEVDNFVAVQTADGYETELQGSYEIFDAQGTKVASQVLPADQQVCDHYLRDYFIAYQMHLPAQLTPGEYRLELSMECVKGKKYGQASLPLVIKK